MTDPNWRRPAVMRTRLSWGTIRVGAAAAFVAVLAVVGVARSAPDTAHVCPTSQLHVWLTHADAGGGSIHGYFAFTNRGPSTCSLRGWPIVVALRAGARTAAAHANYGAVAGYTKPVHGAPTVRLQPERTAVAAFAVADRGAGGAGACPPPYDRLRVTPPGNTASAFIRSWKLSYFGHTIPACSPIVVTQVVPASYLPTHG